MSSISLNLLANASRDWLSRLKQVVTENKRLDALDTDKGKKETNGFRIGTRLGQRSARQGDASDWPAHLAPPSAHTKLPSAPEAYSDAARREWFG